MRLVVNDSKFQFFEPIYEYDSNLINLGFIRYFVFIDQKNLTLNFSDRYITKVNNTDGIFNLNSIDKTVISKRMQAVVNLHKIVRKVKKENLDIEKYLQDNNIEPLDHSLRLKYLMNKYFNMIIKLKNGVKYEVIFLNFDDYKNWLNGIAFIINNKNIFQ